MQLNCVVLQIIVISPFGFWKMWSNFTGTNWELDTDIELQHYSSLRCTHCSFGINDLASEWWRFAFFWEFEFKARYGSWGSWTDIWHKRQIRIWHSFASMITVYEAYHMNLGPKEPLVVNTRGFQGSAMFHKYCIFKLKFTMTHIIWTGVMRGFVIKYFSGLSCSYENITQRYMQNLKL